MAYFFLLTFHAWSWIAGKRHWDFFDLYVLCKFVLDITDIGKGKYHEETWIYNWYKSDIANLPYSKVVINARAFPVSEEVLVLQWDTYGGFIIIEVVFF